MTPQDENQIEEQAEMETEEHDVLFLPRELTLASARFLPTNTDGVLQLDANTVIRYELGFVPIKDRGDQDAICAVVRITDTTGAHWVGQSILWPGELIARLGGLGATEQPQFFSEASKEIHKAFKRNVLISDARAQLGCGFSQHLRVGKHHYEIQTETEGVRLDLAFLGGGATILARVSGLQGRSNGIEQEVPQIVFPVDLDKRLFITYGYMGDDGLWYEDMIPFFVVFEKAETTGPRGYTTVTFVED